MPFEGGINLNNLMGWWSAVGVMESVLRGFALRRKNGGDGLDDGIAGKMLALIINRSSHGELQRNGAVIALITARISAITRF